MDRARIRNINPARTMFLKHLRLRDPPRLFCVSYGDQTVTQPPFRPPSLNFSHLFVTFRDFRRLFILRVLVRELFITLDRVRGICVTLAMCRPNVLATTRPILELSVLIRKLI